MEIWKSIKGYEQEYEVSNQGKIRTKEGKTTYTNGVKRIWKQRIIAYKGHTINTGYRVTLWKHNKPKDFLVARLVAYTFYDQDIHDHSKTVNHIDGNRMNNNLENLEIISLADNIRHAYETGLMTHCKPITLEKDKETLTFRSHAEASRYLNKNRGYVAKMIKKGIMEIEGHKIQRGI